MLRNKEIKQFAFCFAMITIITSWIGFWFQPNAGVLVLLTTTLLGGIFFIFTKARYRSIARISEQIDLVLHNADHLYISEAQEGELSILQSEITKMTSRIREQNEALQREKNHLADSLADIAHQLRTPLTTMNLILSLLENTADENERKNLLRETENLYDRMDWLITALLKLSRLDAGIVTFQKKPINVYQLLQAALRSFLITMDLHNITVRLDVSREIVIEADNDWLVQALQNIFKNCLENIGDNGQLHIACRDTILFTEITIHDSGSGFAQEDLPYLFHRFYRGKNSAAAGYGIGLALCKTIITQQGGTVTAKNHLKGGALFTLRFLK